MLYRFVASLGTSEVRGDDTQGAAPVGLSLFFRDGAAPPVRPVGASPRYLQELDIVATVTPMWSARAVVLRRAM